MAGLGGSGAPSAPTLPKKTGVQPSGIGAQHAPLASGAYGTNTGVTEDGREYDVRSGPGRAPQKTATAGVWNTPAPASNPAAGVIQSMLQQQAQQQAQPAPPPPPQQQAPSAPPINSTVAPNPISNGVVDTLLARSKGDMGAPQALDRGIQRIRANASQGIGKEMAASRAARGVSGGGLDDADNRGLAQGEQGAMNSLTTDIALGRERDRDNLSIAAGNMGLAQGSQQLAGQAQNMGAYNANRDAAFRDQQAQQQQYNTQRDMQFRDTQAQLQNFNTILDILSRGALDGNSALYG